MKPPVILIVVAALTGCAQFQPGRQDASARGDVSAPPAKLVDFVVPADALGARDPQLTALLAKVGMVASKQPQPTTIRVAATPPDFGYLNQSIRRGIAAQRAAYVRVENVAVGSCQPYSIQINPTQ
ncbi:hypothetical protein [Burkholderia guangdongensis]|uniref:hypothetical protein n=1 Tax=Burkholderia guangdongensis TaxID=1792500 RepID=UPI0015CD2B3A|nr:hypothetical protein [Burkholderia guangdongensis]